MHMTYKVCLEINLYIVCFLFQHLVCANNQFNFIASAS